MNCDQAKKNIFMYGELTPSQQRETDEHIQRCNECLALLNEHSPVQSLIRKLSNTRPLPRHHAALTHRIMAATENTERKRVSIVDQWLNAAILRSAFAGLSLTLIVTFFIENRQHNLPQNSGNIGFYDNASLLNSSAFLKSLCNNSHTETFHYQNILACAHDESCTTFSFIKMIRKHEDDI